jgi:hypothetical protein
MFLGLINVKGASASECGFLRGMGGGEGDGGVNYFESKS